MQRPARRSPGEYPQGIIPRVEPQPKHREFVNTVKPPYVMLKITDARRLADKGETATSYFGSVPTVITTSTVRDSQLSLLEWTDEYDIIQRFEPDFHFPADESIYKQYPEAARLSHIKQSLKGLLTIQELIDENPGAFSDTPPTLIPLIQGVTTDEHRICLNLFAEERFPMAGYYAVQYFTTDGQPRTDELLEDLQDLHELRATTHPSLSLFVIGGLGPTLTNQYPDSVDAAAGFTQWYSRVASLYEYHADGSQRLSIDRAHAGYDELARTTNRALNANVAVSYNPEWETAATPADRGRP